MTKALNRFRLRPPAYDRLIANPVLRYGWRAYALAQTQVNLLNTLHPEEYSLPFSKFQIGSAKLGRVNDPEIARHILVSNHKNYDKGSLIRKMLGGVLGNGLIIADGPLWRKNRRIMAPAFHHRAIQRLGYIFTQRTETLLSQWQAKCNARQPVDVGMEMAGLTMDMVMLALFSRDLDGREKQLAYDMNEILLEIGRPPLADLMGLPAWFPRKGMARQAREALGRTAATLNSVLSDRLNSKALVPAENPDLLDLLLASRDSETGEGMDEAQLFDEILTLFGAGHETTSNTLTWALHWLSHHPKWAKAARDEVQAVLGAGANSRAATMDDLQSFTLLPRVLNETLRHCPPAFATLRQALGPDSLDDFETEEGRSWQIHFYMMNHNPKYWDDPWTFNPDNFLPEKVEARPRGVFIPFGDGPRVCIGKAFALQEAQIVLASLIARFDLRLLDDRPAKPVVKLTLRPGTPVRGILSLAEGKARL